MGIEAIVVFDIAECELVQLRRLATAVRIDGQQYWPRKHTSDRTDQDDQLKKAEEQVAIERLVA